jgi:hypothetical protein
MIILKCYHYDNIQDDKFHKIETQLDIIKSEKASIIQESLKKDQVLDSIFSKSENLKIAVNALFGNFF